MSSIAILYTGIRDGYDGREYVCEKWSQTLLSLGRTYQGEEALHGAELGDGLDSFDECMIVVWPDVCAVEEGIESEI